MTETEKLEREARDREGRRVAVRLWYSCDKKPGWEAALERALRENALVLS